MSFALADVTYAYQRNGAPVLRNLTLTLPAGTTTVILGASGAGKSTLLNLLGLLWEGQLAAGRITYHPPGGVPREYGGLTDAERARLRREEFGFIPQNSYLLPGFTCRQNILLPLLLQGLSHRDSQLRLDTFMERPEFNDLRAVLSSLGGEVAGGQRQRMAVLRAVIHNPRVVFADEPVSNLDPENTRTFLGLLRQWHGGHLTPLSAPGGAGLEVGGNSRTLLLVCHDAETAWSLGEWFLFLYSASSEGNTPFLLVAKDRLSGPAEVQQLISCQKQRDGIL